MHGRAHAAASRGTTRPADRGGIKPGSEKSLSGGLAAWLRTRTGGRLPKFPGPDWGEARKPRPPRAGPAQVKRGLRPPRYLH